MTRYGLLLGFLLLLVALLGLPPRHYQVTWVSRTDRRTSPLSSFSF